MSDVSVSNEGMVVLAGVYQLFPIKNIWFWFLGGCASVLAYLITTPQKQRRLTVAIGVFFVALFVLFISGGIARDLFKISIPDWMYAILGFMSNPLFKKFLANTDVIVDALFNKIMKKLDVDAKDNSNEQSDI